MALSNDVAILNVSDANASFKSVVNETSFIDLPLAVPNGSSADANINKRNKWGLVLLLVSLIGCAHCSSIFVLGSNMWLISQVR